MKPDEPREGPDARSAPQGGGAPVGGRLLVVDDDDEVRGALVRVLEAAGHRVDQAASAACCLELVRDHEYACILVDIRLSHGQSGLALCRRLAEHRPDVPVVIVTGHANLDAAIGALRAGAHDFVTKPVSRDLLELAVARAVRHKALEECATRLELEQGSELDPIVELVGSSAPMRAVYDRVRRVSATDVAVLVTGESGTGKDLVARAIHAHSRRADGPFVAINCAALPGTLLESELFGHVKGAFTDAKQSRDGLFVQASQGTLFLDEVGEMSADLQAKLLRALQEQRVRPVGGEQEIPVDARIIAATNADLEAEVEAGRFRKDLLYRIDVVRIDMPPLRARGTDILALAQYFLARTPSVGGRAVAGISREAARALMDYAWPGNARELENAIEHAVALSRSAEIQLEDLPAAIRDYRCQRIVIDGADVESLPTLSEFTQRYIYRVLDAVNGNKSQACRVLGMDRRTLYRKLERFEETRNPK